MAIGFIKQVLNLSDQSISFGYKDDGTWWPSGFVIDGSGGVSTFQLLGRGQVNNPVSVGRMVKTPSIMVADRFNVPWANSGYLDLHGPAGKVRLIIGPTGTKDMDFLRMFDSKDQVLKEIELGPRGGGWRAASWDWHIVVDADRSIRWVTWDVNDAGLIFADQAKKVLDEVRPLLTKAVMGVLLPA